MNKELSIEEVDNGYIVTINKQRFSRKVVVYQSFEEALKAIASYFNNGERF
jgi:hypothetical protein